MFKSGEMGAIKMRDRKLQDRKDVKFEGPNEVLENAVPENEKTKNTRVENAFSGPAFFYPGNLVPDLPVVSAAFWSNWSLIGPSFSQIVVVDKESGSLIHLYSP